MAEPFQFQSVEVRDFSGGKIDNYIGGGSTTYQDADNFDIINALPVIRGGSKIYDATYYQVPAGAQRVGALIEFNDLLLQQSGRNVYFINSGWNTLNGPTGNLTLSSATAANYLSWARWNGHLLLVNDAYCTPMKVYKDAGGTMRATTLGMPALASSPTVTAGAAGANNYVYAFCYYYSYTVGTATFEERGPITLVSLASSAAPNVTPVPITTIPVLANGATGNYDTTVIKCEVYRTANNGTTFYYEGAVTNGTTTYSSTMSDVTLQTKRLLYNQDQSLDYEPPPPCKYVVQAGQVTWYLNVQEGSSTYSGRMRPSNISQPSAAPSSFAEDVDDEIVGGIDLNSQLIVFCKRKAYRVEGFYDPQGRGSIKKTEISSKGCVSNRSIVKTSQGVFFASDDGFYFTDGYKCSRISESINDTFKLLVTSDTQKARIYGCYDSILNIVRWACMKDAGSTDNDCVFNCHLNYGIKPAMCFTTWMWRASSTSFLPTALIFFQNRLLRADTRGYVFEQTSNVQTDLQVDTTTNPSVWALETIMFDIRTCAYDFGTAQVRKWVPKLEVSLKNISNTSMSIQSNNNNGGIFKELKPVKDISNLVWGDEDLVWGDSTLIWNYIVTIDAWRRFPAKGLRCMYKQLRFTNAYVDIRASAQSSTATTNATLKTVTLDVTLNNKWPAKSVGYFISFANDSYAREFLISARTDTTLTVVDVGGLLSALSGSAWKIRGYKKGDVASLLSYTINYAAGSTTQTAYRSGS